MASPGPVVQGMTGKRMNMRLRGFSLLYVRHLTLFCAVSPVVASACGGQSPMDSVVHAFLFVKSGEVLRMSSEGARLAGVVFRGMRDYFAGALGRGEGPSDR